MSVVRAMTACINIGMNNGMETCHHKNALHTSPMSVSMGRNMRLICVFPLLLFFLAGCERSPLEKLVFEHAREQAKINAANFERNKEARERQQLALRRKFDADDPDADTGSP